MRKLLHIDSSIQTDRSVSRQLSDAIVKRLKDSEHPLEVIYRDLAADPLPHLSAAVFASFSGQDEASSRSRDQRDDVTESAKVLEEFLSADIVVIGVAFYNYSIPSSLKAWIDRIVVANRTFSYGGGAAPVGLAGDKRVVVAVARGGIFTEGTSNAQREHAVRYLRDIFELVGVCNIEVVAAEGLAYGPEASAKAVEGALNEIAAM
ncbi:FMN-dependent NADH-azoreductase [Paraburkholderia youngii]|uniref:FMN-dependent NADH-azoreductase n=1 Tax=Paraburkholderia youngii TaxID=2782701 RepID=UPI001590EB2C|nr:NAD(P)H-dependent oxidoreductase [Paraburkholderia youngii]NUX57650.1 FMN-dependent NADH-azoreductase [Paraburkholderia youngii]